MCWFSVAGASAFRVGDQGSDVAEIQGQLANLGYDVTADGAYGPATVEAVKSFQMTQGINADGLVGPSTYAALLGKSMPAVSSTTNSIARRVVSDSAARRRTVSTAPVTSAMCLPMPVFTCRARLTHSMRSATRFPRASSCRATSSSSRRMSRVRRTSASTLAMVISSTHRRARVYRLHPCTVPIGVPAISVPVASCNLFGEGQASLSLFLLFLPEGVESWGISSYCS